MMIRVAIESPFAGEIERNKEYLRRCVLDCLERGESPYASHGFFVQYLDDNNPEERALGIKAGLFWSICADKIVFYTDYGYSQGMINALIFYKEKKTTNIEFRGIGKNQNDSN